MNKEIAHILKERLLAGGGLPFANIVGGMVQTISTKKAIDDVRTIAQRFPASADVTIDGELICEADKLKKAQRDLIPNSRARGVLYFEDAGVVLTGGRSGRSTFRSSLLLVCWMNKHKFTQDDYSMITTKAVSQIMQKLRFNEPVNEGAFIGFSPKLVRVLPQDASMFSKYTYNEEATQYLIPPFDYFGIQIVTDFGLSHKCVNPLTIDGQAC